MNVSKLSVAMVFLFGFIVTVSAEPMQFSVADASSSGTYKQMLGEIKAVCDSEDFVINEGANAGGATDNLEALRNNKVSAAFLHSDVVFLLSLTDGKYRDFKTLVSLYPEEIHVVALRTAKETNGGTLGFGAKPVEYVTLSDLAGRKVGAAGGSAITAKLLAGQGGGNFEVKDDFTSGDKVLEALKNGEIQAAIFVGGAPLANIEKLSDKEFKLLSIGDKIGEKLTQVYKKGVITYANLRSGPINTLTTPAVILTRKYTIPKFVAPQMRFRECFMSKLQELKETPNSHAKWQEVDPADHGVWEWYEFPAK